MNEKTLVFDNGGAMDGNLVAALMNGNNRNNGYGMGYGWEWMWMILLFALWGNNGWGGFEVAVVSEVFRTFRPNSTATQDVSC